MDIRHGKITTVVSIGALVVLVLFFALAVERGKRTPTEDAFQAPVYNAGVPAGALASPLFLEADTASVAADILTEFKRTVLARIASRNPLSDAEKSVLRASISVIEPPRTGALILANQTLLRFTPAELARIEAALAP